MFYVDVTQTASDNNILISHNHRISCNEQLIILFTKQREIMQATLSTKNWRLLLQPTTKKKCH